MARKLRVVVAGGWHHVVNRGNHRESIVRTDTYRRRFLGRVAELHDGFQVEIHALVLMDNHWNGPRGGGGRETVRAGAR